jgi:hypothetical protein
MKRFLQSIKTRKNLIIAVVACICLCIFAENQAKAQAITFTGATAYFITPGISALASGTGAVAHYAPSNGAFCTLGNLN